MTTQLLDRSLISLKGLAGLWTGTARTWQDGPQTDGTRPLPELGAGGDREDGSPLRLLPWPNFWGGFRVPQDVEGTCEPILFRETSADI